MKIYRKIETAIALVAVVCMVLGSGSAAALAINGSKEEPEAVLMTDTSAEDLERTAVLSPVRTPEPDTIPATVRRDNTHAIVGKFERGDIVNIIDESNDDYYIIRDMQNSFYYVEKRFVRTDGKSFGEEQPMYADSDTAIYETAYLEGIPLTTLEKNDLVVEIDELNGIAFCYYQPNDTDEPPVYGYTEAKNLSNDKYSSWQAYYNPPSGGSSGSSGGGSGRSGGSDGEDIFLYYFPDPVSSISAEKISYNSGNKELEITGTEGEIFSDGIEIIAAIFNKGETVNFIEKNNDDFWTILYEHKVCQVPAKSVRIDGEEDPWEITDGYIGVDQTELYDNPEMEGSPMKRLVIRAKVRGLELDGDALYIEVIDSTISACGMKGYIPSDSFTTERPESGDEWYGTSGNSSSGGSASGTSSAPEWSGDYF